MKSCFSVVDRKKADQTLVVGFFEDLFRRPGPSFYEPLYFWREDAFVRISDGPWALESCAITTPSSRLRFIGPYMFEDYLLSLADHETAGGAEKVEIFTRAIESDPNNSTYLKELAYAYHHVGQYENAIEIYQKRLLPIASGKERKRIENALGELFMITQEYDAAITMLQQMWLDGGHEPRKLLLQAYLKAEMYEAAKQLAVFMIEKDYGEERTLSDQVFEAIGDDQMLIQLCENAAHRNPESYHEWYRLADCYKRLKYFEKGIECLKTVCESSWVWQLHGLGRLDFELLLVEMSTEVGNHEQAIRRMEEVCKSSWSWRWGKYYIYEKLMRLHLEHGNKELARGAFQHAAAAFIGEEHQCDEYHERNGCWRTLSKYALLFENYDFVINEFPRTQFWDLYESDWENFWMALNKEFGRDVAIQKYAQEIEKWRQTIWFKEIPELHVTKVS